MIERPVSGGQPLRRPAALLVIAAITLLALVAVVGGPAAHATFPAGNGLIAFAGDKGSGAEIYTIKPDGTGLHRLTNVSGGDTTHPDWSPDGTRIAFGVEDKAVYVMNADGSDLHKVTAPGGEPAFTRDGHHLVYWCDACPGRDGVFLVRDDGANAPGRRLTANPFRDQGDENPEVSPNGRIVTFVRHKVGGELQALYAVNIGGGNLRRLTTYQLEVAIKQDWAPNGRRIVITTQADYPHHRSPNVATIRPNGSHLRMLTHYRGGAVGAFAGSYSPNGRLIVFRVENLEQESFRLFKMYPDGTHRKLIRKLPFSPRNIDWGPR